MPNAKTTDERYTRSTAVRFTDAQHKALRELLPPGMEFAAFLRELALKGAGMSGDRLIHRAVAFIVGAISPDISPEQAAALFAEFLAAEPEVPA